MRPRSRTMDDRPGQPFSIHGSLRLGRAAFNAYRTQFQRSMEPSFDPSQIPLARARRIGDVPVVAVTGKYPQIQVYRPDSGERLYDFEACNGNDLCQCYYRNELVLAAAELNGDQSQIAFYDPVSQARVGGLSGHSDDVVCLSPVPSPCGPSDLLASGSLDQTVRVWDLWREKMRTGFGGHQGWIWSVCSILSRPWIVSCSADRTVRAWDVVQEAAAISSVGRHNGVVNCVCAGHGENIETVLACSNDKSVKMFSLDRMRAVKTFTCDTGNYSVIRHPNQDHWFFVGGEGGLVTMWDDRLEKKHLKKAEIHGVALRGRQRVTVRDIAYVGHHRFASCCSHGDDLSVKVWNSDLKLGTKLEEMNTGGANYGICCLVPFASNRLAYGDPTMIDLLQSRALIRDVSVGVANCRRDAAVLSSRVGEIEQRVQQIEDGMGTMKKLLDEVHQHMQDEDSSSDSGE